MQSQKTRRRKTRNELKDERQASGSGLKRSGENRRDRKRSPEEAAIQAARTTSGSVAPVIIEGPGEEPGPARTVRTSDARRAAKRKLRSRS
ncbi:hypothetical protein NL676_019175 [Syzygium grande]|nr:hypothetical protein NL676_019175 [Syzygium grande]